MFLETCGSGEFGFGLLLASFTVGALPATAMTARLEQLVGTSALITGAVVAMGVPWLVPYATDGALAIAASFVVASAAGVAWNIVTVSLRQRITPDHLLGRMNATYRLLGWGTMPAGAAVGGAIGEVFGVRAVFLFAAAASLVLLVPAVLVLTSSALADAELDQARKSATRCHASAASSARWAGREGSCTKPWSASG